MTQKTLLLTGASRGIGHATVKLFQAAGWRVLTVSRSAFDARCPWHAGTSDHFQGDLADPAARADLVARLRETLGDGGLNAIVNNAGISPKGPQGERLGVATSSDEIWRQVLAVNLIGPAALMRDLRTRHSVAVDAVAVLVGSAPDLSFLPRAVRDTLAAAGPPRQESAEGIKATHPVFVDVDPFSMQVQAVPSLFALGPLRGDNFARFAIHDGWGVAHAIRTQAAQVEGSQQLCEREATAAAAVAAVQDLK